MIETPNATTSCAAKCHYSGNLIGASIITSVPVSKEVPTTFALDQNHPNPFNPSTTIQFSVPTREFVTIAVYDMLGRYVITLANELVEAGTYRVVWYGIDHAGSAVSSGIYFYRLEAVPYVQARKMSLVR